MHIVHMLAHRKETQLSCFYLHLDPTSIFSRIHSWDARDMSWHVTNSWPCHDMTCHVLMFQVRQSDQVTGHCTDYLLSLYTRSVTRGTMVIFDTNQVVRLSTGGGKVINFFCQLLPLLSRDTLVSKIQCSWH